LTVPARQSTLRRLDVRCAVVSAALLLALVAGVGAGSAKPTPAPKAPAGIDWGAGHFTNPEQLNAWLADRGVRYAEWLQRHPRGAYLITHARRAGPPAPRARASGLTGAGFLAIYALVAALLLLAFTPTNVLLRVVPIRYHARLTTARTTFAAAGLSLVLGVIIVSIL
jgi:hypothetical protein